MFTSMRARESADWHGRTLVDVDGRKIGRLQDVYVDVETDEPMFATVKVGLLGRRRTFVPLRDITTGPHEVHVAVTRIQVRSALSIEAHGTGMSPADEGSLYAHFGLRYRPFDVESHRRLGRR
jgi:sporulation protein YlmC with PRC-barrel domain